MSRTHPSLRIPRRVAWSLALLLCLSASSAPAAPPTVNGLFYGDGDNNRYIHWDTSYYGSKLYVYLDVPNTTLHVALVVDRSVNDNVFGASHAGYAGNYMESAGWGKGRGQQRSAADLVNSEFASFEFACEEGAMIWDWQQGYACEQGGTWLSDSSCGTSSPGTNGYPTTLTSASSFATNINTYNANSSPAWDLFFFGTTRGNWKSPFAFDDPNTDPPNNPNTVIGLDGYPAATSSGDLSLGPPITYSSVHQYEWSMVFEWSLNIGVDGTNCSTNNLFLVSGASHHSPMKEGVAGDFDQECGEENDCFPPGGGEDPLSDFGDLPDTYGTYKASSGAQHYITVAGPYLGTTVEVELDGHPTSDATGDGPEEDGVTLNTSSEWTAGSTRTIDVVVSNAPGGALLGAWFDWNNDGDFADPGEFFSWSNLVEGTNTLEITVGQDYDWLTDDLYARFRIVSAASKAPGGNGWQQTDAVGIATDGEVEDYYYAPGTNPVTLNAFSTEGEPGGEVTVRWQTASETDNVAFEVWGLVQGEWQVLSDLVPTRGGTTSLPQSYEARIAAPAGLTRLQLVDYDSRGRLERFGPYALGQNYGEVQPVRQIDWRAARAERTERLRERGFEDTRGPRDPATSGPQIGRRRGEDAAGAARWKKVRGDQAVSGPATRHHGAAALTVDTRRGGPGSGTSAPSGIQIQTGPQTHVAVTEPGIQRVSYEDLRDGGLDLEGTPASHVAVTWRGEPVERWIDGPGTFGPGSAIEFLGRPPEGDDALYVDANLYQVAVSSSLARGVGRLGQGKARNLSSSYLREAYVDRPGLYQPQSATGDPWVERYLLVRRGRTTTVTLDVPVEGPVADGPSHLVVGLGTATNLRDLRDAQGNVLPEHNVDVWFRGPGGDFTPVTSASTSGYADWRIEATLPPGLLEPGINQVQLRFSTPYFYSLVLVDRYGVRYPSPYRGPALDFAPDPWADGYRVEGLAGPATVAYAEGSGGSLTRIDPRVIPSADGYAVELRQTEAERYWVTERPHAPEVFTTEAPPDLLGGPADLVVIAGSSFVGTAALDDYLAQKAAFDPVVVDVEDIYNAVGFGMALPSAITDYLAARDAIHPFTHVQLVGTDCYDRRNYVSQCLSHVPLPTAPVHVTAYSPSQNRLVDLTGDGVGDKAVGQFSVRDEAELATIVRKGAAWSASNLSVDHSALLIAEETDGVHDFSAQIERLRERLDWSGTEVIHLSEHPDIRTARDAMRSSLEAGRSLTVFSGHSSPTVWAFRALLTAGSAASLTNDGRPTIMVPLACETTYDISPNANVLGHQLLFAGDQGALAIAGAVALSNPRDNERMANYVLDGLKAGLTVGEAVQSGRRALGTAHQELHDNWLIQGDATARVSR